jgi:5-methylcytosine-specific restriction endonuclease McrA
MKKSALKRSTKHLKRTPLKRKSKSKLSTLRRKADRLLQDYHRLLGLSCEVCGEKQELMHHFVPQSASANLKFNDRNLIPLCFKCHFAHHQKGDPRIHGLIIAQRGLRWFAQLEKDRHIVVQRTQRDYQEIVDAYMLKIKYLDDRNI